MPDAGALEINDEVVESLMPVVEPERVIGWKQCRCCGWKRD